MEALLGLVHSTPQSTHRDHCASDVRSVPIAAVTSTQRSAVCRAGILGSARARIVVLKRAGCPTCPFPGCLA